MPQPLGDLLRGLVPQVLGGLVRSGTPFADAEDAVQEAVLEALEHWPASGTPASPVAWLRTVARRKLTDAARSDIARRRREDTVSLEPDAGPAVQGDDTLTLMFLCCHPVLSATAAVPLTLRAVAGLTTREIAEAYLLPEATIAQRISRAKKTLAGRRLDEPGSLDAVLRVLYLVFNEGYGGRVDVAAEAVRVTRLLYTAAPQPEVGGLLALMLLHHARRGARTSGGRLVPLEEQDRTLWDRALIAEGFAVLQVSLAAEQRGEYQLQAAIAALHDDAESPAETDWPQIVAWYDELVALTGNPLARLSRAVAVGGADGPQAGLAALAGLDEALPGHHRLPAVRAHLLEQAGDPAAAAELFAAAARGATSAPERDHLLLRAARARELASRP